MSVMGVVRVHPDPPFNPLKSILSENSENKFYFSKYAQLYTVDSTVYISTNFGIMF